MPKTVSPMASMAAVLAAARTLATAQTAMAGMEMAHPRHIGWTRLAALPSYRQLLSIAGRVQVRITLSSFVQFLTLLLF